MMTSELTDYERRIVENVEKFGTSVTTVFDPDGDSPNFSYSIGFPKSVGQPEIIVFGLNSDLMHFIINEVHRQCADEGLVLIDGKRIADLIDGFECVVREIGISGIDPEYFNSAMWFSQKIMDRPMQRAFQIVWPGAEDGRFPWDNGADEIVIANQPALYEATGVSA